MAVTLCNWACDNAELSPLTGEDDIYVYLPEAASNKVMDNLLLGAEITDQPVTVRLNHAADHDVTVHFALFDDEMMEELNQKVKGSFKCIPAEYIGLPESVVIPAGQTAGTLNLTCRKFSMGDAKYVIPYYITHAEGASVTSTSSRYALSLTSEIGETNCWVIGPKNTDGVKVKPSTSWDLSLPKFTIEWWVKQEKMTRNNQAMIWMGADGQPFNARFGDVDYGGNYKYLQIKLPGSQSGFDTGNPVRYPDRALKENTWYHFAVCFDGSDDGAFTLYKNGELVMDDSDNTKVMTHYSNIQEFKLNKLNFADAGDRNAKTYMCQVRLWNTVRTQEQIKKYMFVEPQYTDPELVFYLPMNEGEGREIKDVTGNGHDGTIGSLVNNEKDGEWSTVTILSSHWPE